MRDEPVDLMIWDYGMNDLATMPLHKEFMTGFFEKVAATFPDISSIGAVYWLDETTKLNEQVH